MKYVCDCGFECASSILHEQHQRRCKTGLSEADYLTYLKARKELGV